MSKYKKELAKELALVTAIILQEGIFEGSVFQNFDKIYSLAKKFVKKYPVDTQWGISEGCLEYDETIIKFVNKKLNK